MGSSLSIKNNTDGDIWVWNGVDWDYVLWPIEGVIGVIGILSGAGAIAGAMAAEAVVEVSASAVEMVAEEEAAAAASAGAVADATAGKFLGLTSRAWSIGRLIAAGSAATAVAVLTAAGGEKAKAEKAVKVIKDFQKGCNVKLSPGKTYTYDCTLSLVRSVKLMNENGEVAERECWTGATAGSCNHYDAKDWPWKSTRICKFTAKKEGDGKK